MDLSTHCTLKTKDGPLRCVTCRVSQVWRNNLLKANKMGRNSATIPTCCAVVTILVLGFILLRALVLHSTLLALQITAKTSTSGSGAIHNSKPAKSAELLISQTTPGSDLFGVIIPRFTPEEHHSLLWSSEPLILRRGHRLTILHKHVCAELKL